MKIKQCSKCGKRKSLNEFHVRSCNKDGRCANCKTCAAEYNRKYRPVHRERDNKRGRLYYADHREELREKARAYYATHKNEYRELNRRWHDTHVEETRELGLKYRYGLSNDDYNAMFVAQQGKCAICGGDGDGIKLQIDHDHKTGAIRALLCKKCNIAIGIFRENAPVVLKAFQYLTKWTPKGSD